MTKLIYSEKNKQMYCIKDNVILFSIECHSKKQSQFIYSALKGVYVNEAKAKK